MSKQCSFCGRKFGMFSSGYEIADSPYCFCDDHLEFKIRLEKFLRENIDADLTQMVEQHRGKLCCVSPDFNDASDALIASIRNRNLESAQQEEKRRIQEQQEAEQRQQEAALRQQEKERELQHQQAIAKAAGSMLLTTGYSFDGYRIVKYCDVIFDELIIGMGFFKSIAASFDNLGAAIMGGEADVMSTKLNSVKSLLRDRVKEKAILIGANALIGIDFESSTMGELIVVSMTATAVIIEKKE